MFYRDSKIKRVGQSGAAAVGQPERSESCGAAMSVLSTVIKEPELGQTRRSATVEYAKRALKRPSFGIVYRNIDGYY